MASTLTVVLGRSADVVRATLDRLRAARYLERLWDKDASLWSSDGATQASIRQRLGWLTLPRLMAAQTASLRQCAQEVRAAGFSHALLLGMGGSGLFSEVCRNTFGLAPQHPDLAVLDTTDPTAIVSQQRRCPLKELFIIVSSKSGSTSEISALSRYFYETFKSADGAPGAHGIAITDAGTPLEAQAAAWQFRRTFVHGPTSGADVGGRFSALTFFGLVPAAIIGVDTSQLLARAIEMLDRCGPDRPLEENPGAQLGAVLAALAGVGRDKMTLLCSPALESFGTWVEQLVAESTGKLGKGIAPFFGEPPRDPSAYGNDRVFVELQMASDRDAAVDRQVLALAAAGHPVVRIHWQDRYDLGGEVSKWSIATTITGGLMGINPFDEPNVQESKDRTKALLAQYAHDHRFPPETPLLADGPLALFSTSMDSPPGSVAQGLSRWLQQARPGDYVAILSFLPRTSALDHLAQAVRARMAAATGRATMLGFGPRYLHSTGQLYKGGPDAALFLQLTAEDPADLPIPGEPFTFGVLKQAQPLGDFQAMQQKGRRVLRVHLCGDLDQAAQRLMNAITDATAAVAKR